MNTGSWLPVVAFVLVALVLQLGSVWINIERTAKSYDIERLENLVEAKEKDLAKLLVERENQLSPPELKKLAAQLGLGPAEPGQIRRLPLPAE